MDLEEWIGSHAGACVVGMRPLAGGITSDVHEVTLADGERLVLRRYARRGSAARADVEREAATLTALATSGLPTPHLIAAEPTGEVPMVLMTRVPGEIHLTPSDPDEWLAELARALVTIHAQPVPPGARAVEEEPRARDVPVWSARPELWRHLVRALSGPPPVHEPCFIHGDYQHFNVLWRDGRISGIVDWVYAGTGHPDRDAAHCRLNLAVLFSIEHAEHFRARYEAEIGRVMDPWWDLYGLAEYGQDWKEFIPMQVDGGAPVDTDGMDDRIEGLIARALARA